MPAVANAMRGAMTPEQLWQFSRAVGNCQQPLAHRGPIAYLPPSNAARNRQGTYTGWSPVEYQQPGPGIPGVPGSSGAPGGYGGGDPFGGFGPADGGGGITINIDGGGPFNYGEGPWQPGDYQSLFPTAGSNISNDQFIFGGGDYNGPPWNTGNQYGSNFFFPTDQHFTQNQYFGGPQFYINHTANIENIYNQNFEGDRVVVNNLTTQVVNGRPVAGPPGPPGGTGQRGADGLPGPPGGDFYPGFLGAFQPLQVLQGMQPRIDQKKTQLQIPNTYWAVSQTTHTVATSAIAGGTVTVSPQAVTIVVPTGVTFDATNCAVTFSGTTSFVVASADAVTASLSATPAPTAQIWATTANYGASQLLTGFQSTTPKTILGAQFPAFSKIEVVRDATLRGIKPVFATVLQR